MESPACPPPTMTVSTNSVISILRGSRFNNGPLFLVYRKMRRILLPGKLDANAFRNSISSTLDSASTIKDCQCVVRSRFFGLREAYDSATSSMVWSDERARIHRELVDHYRMVFQSQRSQHGSQAEWITDARSIQQLTAFFAWSAWTGAAARPGKSYSYTDNWPPEPLASNDVTADAIV